jgi:hypothetical protein
LQISLVYINTLMIQRVLAEPAWSGRLTAEDLRALTPLSSRSNWAKDNSIFKTKRPMEVALLNSCVMETNET